MASRAFDTLAAARTLESSGVDRKTAEAIVDVMATGHDGLALKSDLNPIRSDIVSLRSDITALRWFGGLHMLITLATFGAVLHLAFSP